MQSDNPLRTELARLVLEDPREARSVLQTVIDRDPTALEQFLQSITSPEDARLRHLVANIARGAGNRDPFLRHLILWRTKETDEFTKRALKAALQGVDESLIAASDTQIEAPVLPDLVDVYAYVAERLQHRLRNALLSAQGHLVALRSLLNGSVDGAGVAALAHLNESMKVMGRELNAIDVDPDHFRERSIVLGDWLKAMNDLYTATYSPIVFDISGATDARVTASDYLLSTIFWNIWQNAHQHIGRTCRISIDVQQEGKSVTLVVTDNGSGFPSDMLDYAFQLPYSTKSENRGRGLFEMQDAVNRLRGRIRLFQRPGIGDIRIRMTLPMSNVL